MRARRAMATAAMLAGVLLGWTNEGRAQAQQELEARVQAIMARPEFARSNFGVEFVDYETGKVLYAVNPEKMFVPASTTKLLTEGTVLAKLGGDFRFHTRIYRTGAVKGGKLKGDLILVASGDPNLSNRIKPDGTLAFEDEDHTYGGPALPGDPLAVIEELAKQVHDKGIRKIEGNVYVDASLLPDGQREGGTGTVLSSVVLNDNVVDLVITPGAKAGDAAKVSVRPETSYLNLTMQVTTGAANSKFELDSTDPETNPDGSIRVTLTGSIAAGSKPETTSFAVPSPTLFATAALRTCLKNAGVEIHAKKGAATPNFVVAAKQYTEENLVAEHVSPPLSEDVRITLKVSQNLHAGMGPYYLGLIVAKNRKDPLDSGFKVENEFLKAAKLDLTGASQGDGEGGDPADLFSPDFMCRYLMYWKTRPDFAVFYSGLPILGKDGTLAKIQVESPAAGHVFAKTGTFGAEDRLNDKLMLTGKGLAGYVITKSGKTVVFAAYVNHVSLSKDKDEGQRVAGQALGEIAGAAYETLP